MKILFYSDNLYPEISGISDSILNLGQELKRRGHTVAFAAPGYSRKNYAYVGRTPEQSSAFDEFEVYRIPSISFGAAASGMARFVAPLGFSLGFVKRFKPDIIHAQSPFGSGIEALIASKIFGIPLVGTNHTIIDQFIRIYGPIRTQWAVRAANKLFVLYYNRCKSVSAPVVTLLEEMKRYGLKVPTEAISNPIPLALFSPATAEEKEALRKELGLVGKKIVIFSGRVATEKKIEVIIKAIEILAVKDHMIKFVIAGNGPIEEKLKAYVIQEDIEAHVIFTGFLDHATLAKWYKAADVFASMCDIETQCLSLMQAFATALPTAGVNAGAIGIHIKTEFGYTVPDQDHVALAAALEKILTNPQQSELMGKKALEYVKSFSDTTVAQKWEEVYKEALNRI
jgi:glycosyltransferase involved in cell wall biosynthesis